MSDVLSASAMHERIVSAAAALSRERGFEILYACESGSRAWGFASADSDYDIRMIVRFPARRYLSLSPPKDAFDLMDGDLDFGAWDLRKACTLLLKNNATLFEWLHSPVVYLQTPAAEALRRFTRELFDPRRVLNHYVSMSRQVWHKYIERVEQPIRKKYLYVLRPLACAQFLIQHGTQPPTVFADVLAAVELPSEVRGEIDTLVTAKTAAAELGRMDRQLVLDGYIVSQIEAATAAADAMPRRSLDATALDAWLTDLLMP